MHVNLSVNNKYVYIRTFWVGCPDWTLQSVMVKGYHCMHGDIILVGKFVLMVVTSATDCNVWSGQPTQSGRTD